MEMPEKYLVAMNTDRTNLFGSIPGKGDWMIPGQNPADSGFNLPQAGSPGAPPPTGETPRQQPLVAGAPTAPNAPALTLDQGYRQWIAANQDTAGQVYASMFEQTGA
jgi:hypothetical protein